MLERRFALKVFGSGSSGNALFVQLGRVGLVIDAGLSFRRVAKELAAIGVEAAAIAGVLVTHEHHDHCLGLGGWRRTCPQVPIYGSAGTLAALPTRKRHALTKVEVRANARFAIDEVSVLPFANKHDAAEPLGYRLETADFAVAVATDLGEATLETRLACADVQVLVIESNHDVHMLAHGPYPPRLRARVASARGHLSNCQCGRLLTQVVGPRLEHVVLAHLSDENNTPDLALAAARQALVAHPAVRIDAVPQRTMTPLFTYAGRPATRAPVALVPRMRQGALPLY